jgi:OmpA-OmpF porin, OOP family
MGSSATRRHLPWLAVLAALCAGCEPSGSAATGGAGSADARVAAERASGASRPVATPGDAQPAGQPAAGVPGAGLPLPGTSGAAAPTEENIRATGQAIAGLVGGGAGSRAVDETPTLTAQEALQVIAELGRPGMSLSDAQRAQLEAAQRTLYGAPGSDRQLRNQDRVREALGLQAQAARIKADWLARQPADWKLHRHVQRGGEAELIVRVGDIDNLGFGWPVDFDPFSGAATPPHPFPWKADPADPPGTDRIMVISGWRATTRPEPKHDGYTRTTRRPANAIEPVTLQYELGRTRVSSARLQLFVDDFQAPSFGNRFRVLLDEVPAPYIAEVLNTLRQRGPVGKLVTVQVLPEHLPLLADGALRILIDDPHTDVGDGYALDFVRLLINPGAAPARATVSGTVVDRRSREPIAGALVSAASVVEDISATDGGYRLQDVPAGLAVVTASHPQYRSESVSRDLVAGGAETVEFRLEPRDERSRSIQRALDEDGQVDLYGIEFDTNEATIKAESEPTLNAVLEVLERRDTLAVRIAGHTDDVGTAESNRALSGRRARAVRDWLVQRGIAVVRLDITGSGESQPVASNATAEGRARNRRVEISVRR